MSEKTKLKKWPYFDQIHGLNLGFNLIIWKNDNSSTVSTCCFYSLESRFFVLEYRKRHLPSLYCLKKQNWKNGHFWTKTMGQCPLWKNVNFLTVSTSSFYSLKRRFFVLEYRRRYFPGLYCLKKQLEKWPFLDKNHALTPLEKCQFFDCLNFLFLLARKAFFCSTIS